MNIVMSSQNHAMKTNTVKTSTKKLRKEKPSSTNSIAILHVSDAQNGRGPVIAQLQLPNHPDGQDDVLRDTVKALERFEDVHAGCRRAAGKRRGSYRCAGSPNEVKAPNCLVSGEAACRHGLSARSGYRSACLEISQHRETGSSRKEVLERMTAQDEIRMDRVVVELEQLGERIKRGGGDPVERAGIFGLAQQEQQRQGEVGKELHPAVETQIPARAPQQQTEYSGCEQRPEQNGSQPCAHALLDDDRKNRHEAQRHG